MDLNQAEQGLFFFFCQNFGNYLMIFQSFAARSTLKNHQICQKFRKNEENPWTNLP